MHSHLFLIYGIYTDDLTFVLRKNQTLTLMKQLDTRTGVNTEYIGAQCIKEA